jgi:hypothetical protein
LPDNLDVITSGLQACRFGTTLSIQASLPTQRQAAQHD